MSFRKSSAKRLWACPLSLFAALVSIASLMFPLTPSLDVAVAAAEAPAIAETDAKPLLAPQATVIAEYDFDDGTTQDWGPFGSSIVTATTEITRSGSHSLKVTGRTADYEGAGLNVLGLLDVGATYTISGCTRLVAGETPTQTIITLKETVGGVDEYIWIAPTAEDGVTDSGWTCVQGSYTYADAATGLTLYVQSPNPTAEFYLDDFFIVMTSPPPAGQEIIALATDFESGTLEGWEPRLGSETLTVTTAAAYSGTHSLLTSDRSQAPAGPKLDVLSVMTAGIPHDVSVWVMLGPGEETTNMRLTMETKRTGIPTHTYTTIVWNTEVTSNTWVHLQGSHARPADAEILEVYVETASGTAPFYIDTFSLSYRALPPIQTDIPSISETYSTTFWIGAALEPVQLDSLRHTQLLTYHFSSLTAENVMKPGPIHPSEGTYNWTGADTLADFARANGMVMHGHTLQWHQQNAEWMLQDEFGDPLEATPENKTLVLDRLRTHVYSVTERYGDVVNVWDVVNEVIDESQPNCMRQSEWYRLTGSDYISVAFNAAYEKVPTATLILNDYGTTNTTKRECIYTVVQDLKAQGVPISGIGMQMHVNVDNPSPAAIEATIERFAELGVEVHITELDVSVYTDNTTSYDTVPEELLIQQGYRYYDLFEVFKRQADHIGSVTFWGMADDHTWLTDRPIPRVDAPMPFDQQQQAKYAYWGIIGNLSEIPPLIQTLDVPQGTPTVDGSSEFLWDILPWIEVDATETLTANFQTRWDADYLYVIVDVEDATANVTDTVEIFVDENNDKTETYGSDDVHYTYQNGVCSPTVGVTCTAQTTANGYLLEAALPFSGTASVGMQIGFDVRVTDGSQAAFPISWNDPIQEQDTNTANWGTLTFIDAVKTTEAIHGLPTIDAVEDDAWAGANAITTDVWVQGTSGATATVKTMWGAGRLYVYAVVSDAFLTDRHSNAWEEDSLEIFVDQNNGKTSSYQTDDSQYRVNYRNAQSVGNQTSVDDLTSATRILTASSVISPGEVITMGYVVELAIRLDEVAPSDGVLIGFDIQVNDDAGGDAGRDSVVTWNDPSGQAYQDPSKFGVLMFTGVEYTNYMPVIARNADMSGDESRLDRYYPR
jgi:endo-1,4-beta-xylanase